MGGHPCVAHIHLHPNINPAAWGHSLPPVAMARLSHYGKAVREKKEKGTGGREKRQSGESPR